MQNDISRRAVFCLVMFWFVVAVTTAVATSALAGQRTRHHTFEVDGNTVTCIELRPRMAWQSSTLTCLWENDR